VRRRIITITVVLTALLGGGSAASAIGPNSGTAGGYWGCVGVEAIDKAICVKNPLPERLPLPDVPPVPA
jgi:hypothetical protein